MINSIWLAMVFVGRRPFEARQVVASALFAHIVHWGPGG